jgi:leader peptidase (prepilin peptidase)/N-methyltransferase
MFWLLLFFFALLGAALGSFTTALIHRIRNNQSWVFAKDNSAARSCCPKCDHLLSVLDLIPILSWLGLRGCCRYCQRPISFQYICIEIISMAVAIVIFLSGHTIVTMVFLLLLLPFILAQIILFIQNKFISAQLWFIMGGVVISYLALYWT